MFETPSGQYSSSVAIDASTIKGTTVTTAAHITRNREIELLDSVLRHSDAIQSSTHLDGDERVLLGGFKPFRTKAADLDRDLDRRFFEGVIAENKGYITGFQHIHRGNAQTHQIEAVHSAILINDILKNTDGRPLILLDGDEGKGSAFVRAVAGLTNETVDVVHCFRAEWYYPHALLADLSANYIAGQIHNGNYSYNEPLLRTPLAKQTRGNDWGKAFSSMETSREEYVHANIRTKRGDSAAERARCWFDGAVTAGPGDEQLITASTTPIENYLRQLGHCRLADEIAEL